MTGILRLFAGRLRVCRATGIEPSHTQYVEAHGIGTDVGDSHELMAIDGVYRAGAGHIPRSLCSLDQSSPMWDAVRAAGLAGDTGMPPHLCHVICRGSHIMAVAWADD